MNTREQTLHALQRQVKRLNRRIIILKAISDRFMRWRLVAFLLVAIAIFVGLALQDYVLTAVISMVGFAGFSVLVHFHRQVTTTIAQFKVWEAIKRTHIARMTLNWERIPPPYLAKFPENHPFVIDLDMMGWRSVHQLLDTSISLGGSQLLLDWLLAIEPTPDDITHRQSIGRELASIGMFRDRLTMNAFLAQTKSTGRWRADRVLKWLAYENPIAHRLGRVLPILAILSLLNIVFVILFNVAVDFPPLWVGTGIAYLGLSAFQWSNLAGSFAEGLVLLEDLRQFSAILAHLETYNFGERKTLKALCEPITMSSNQPSKQLRRVSRLVGALSLQRNPIFWFAINFVVPWDVFFAHLLEQRKRALVELVPQWLDVWYELESLNSLANFANLNPDYTYPDVDSSGETVFNGVGLGHPLIAYTDKITNDFALDDIGQTVILTGSNMSGKSSFLRTLGVNLRLAYAGSVVNAESLHIGQFRVFTSIKVSDSLADGFSYFYAEVRRLKHLLNALCDDNPIPLFFLIDEIFRGTNNRERLIGSRSYIRALVSANGVGIIATHDLELVKLEEESAQISNYHFREEVIDNKIAFDYTLHTGPCPSTNALKIMAIEGLPVEDVEAVNP